MSTERTVEEARAYIEKAIANWNMDDEGDKIISLAKFVERWSNKGGGPKAKIKSISKDIKAFALMIKRAKDRSEEVSALEGMQSDLKKELDKLERDSNTGLIINKQSRKTQ